MTTTLTYPNRHYNVASRIDGIKRLSLEGAVVRVCTDVHACLHLREYQDPESPGQVMTLVVGWTGWRPETIKAGRDKAFAAKIAFRDLMDELGIPHVGPRPDVLAVNWLGEEVRMPVGPDGQHLLTKYGTPFALVRGMAKFSAGSAAAFTTQQQIVVDEYRAGIRRTPLDFYNGTNTVPEAAPAAAPAPWAPPVVAS